MRLYLDEMISPTVAAALRKRGHDVAATGDRGALAARDTAQLALAIHEQRALVTYDLVDFPSLAWAATSTGRDHWGVVLIHSRTILQSDVGGLIRALDALLRERPEADALKNQIIFLRPAPADGPR